jgi:hypothetical protein
MLVDFLNNYKTEIFVVTVILIHYVFYILIYLNINIISENTVRILNTILQVSISLFLIFRFWYYSSKSSAVINTFDRRVIISSATFMLLNAITQEIFVRHQNKIADMITNFPVFSK